LEPFPSSDPAHLGYHVHKSGCKTSIIIIIQAVVKVAHFFFMTFMKEPTLD